MNSAFILFRLREANDEPDRRVREPEEGPDYDYGEFLVAMMHLYHRMNTAWNIRDVDTKRAQACAEDDSCRWCQFPSDIDMSA